MQKSAAAQEDHMIRSYEIYFVVKVKNQLDCNLYLPDDAASANESFLSENEAFEMLRHSLCPRRGFRFQGEIIKK